MMSPQKQIVRDGYNAVSYAYRSDTPDSAFSPYRDWIAGLLPLLPAHARVLDLGCGCGLPATRLLVKSGYDVTGIDIPEVQIARARRLVPAAKLVCGDMCDIDFAPHTFAAVVSFYALIHIPVEEQPHLLARMYEWVHPGGCLLATVGTDAWTGTERNWLGVEGGTMYWSHADAATYRHWLTAAGWTVVWDRFIPEGAGGHTLVLCHKPQITS